MLNILKVKSAIPPELNWIVSIPLCALSIISEGQRASSPTHVKLNSGLLI